MSGVPGDLSGTTPNVSHNTYMSGRIVHTALNTIKQQGWELF